MFCLVCSDAARAAVLDLWQGWTDLSVSPLLAQASDSGGLVLVKGNKQAERQ